VKAMMGARLERDEGSNAPPHGSFDSIVTGLADELCDGAFMHGNLLSW
jgi:hypothetical protein